MCKVQFYALCKMEGIGEAVLCAEEAGIYFETVMLWIATRG